MHRDLKPENVLLNFNPPAEGCALQGQEPDSSRIACRQSDLNRLLSDPTCAQHIQIKVADFGLARQVCVLPSLFLVAFFSRHTQLVRKLTMSGTKPVKFSKLGSQEGPLTTYISTRWYRPPEILLGAEHYGAGVDLWAAGAVIGECMLLDPLFPGTDNVDQLSQIALVLGQPLSDLPPAYHPRNNLHESEQVWPEGLALARAAHFRWPRTGHTNLVATLFRTGTPSLLVDLVQQLLKYNPGNRAGPAVGLRHPVFARYAWHLPPPVNTDKLGMTRLDYAGELLSANRLQRSKRAARSSSVSSASVSRVSAMVGTSSTTLVGPLSPSSRKQTALFPPSEATLQQSRSHPVDLGIHNFGTRLVPSLGHSEDHLSTYSGAVSTGFDEEEDDMMHVCDRELEYQLRQVYRRPAVLRQPSGVSALGKKRLEPYATPSNVTEEYFLK